MKSRSSLGGSIPSMSYESELFLRIDIDIEGEIKAITEIKQRKEIQNMIKKIGLVLLVIGISFSAHFSGEGRLTLLHKYI